MGNPPKGQATIRHLLNLLNVSDSPEPVRILVCRALSNAASHEFGQQMLLTEISTFCSAVSKQFRSPKAALQVTTTPFHYSIVPLADRISQCFGKFCTNFAA